MYLPNRATIDEACEWLQHQTGQKWTLPRLLEEGHLVPYVWIDYVEGLSQIFGDRREGYLTKMVYHGDVVRLAADRSEALLTMFTAHDGNLIRPTPGWRVDLKDIRFLKNDLQRVAEIINKAAQPQAATPAPVAGIATNNATPDPERRLARLRALGGDAIYRRGEWKITGISALVASEKGEGRKRCDEKTIRADLKEAAESEREAKRANAFSGLGQR